MQLLSKMTDEQTLVLYSGHPMGLFPSSPNAPRVVVTNGMMIPNYSKISDWNKYNALGVTQYGQMTAGSFMYIGPQGIVHGTTITLLNAGRKKGLGRESLGGTLYVTSGLGGMSGAQSLAAEVTGCVGVIAEVDDAMVEQRIQDGYIKRDNVYANLDPLIKRIAEERSQKNGIALIYHGNIVDLWEYLNKEGVQVDLGSDQTSLHNIQDLGYCPVDYTFEEAQELLQKDSKLFMQEARSSLRRHVDAVNKQVENGMYFWDYGNAFLKEAGESEADIWADRKKGLYKYKSYVEDIMGPMCFDWGFGPFRWVCASNDSGDLATTDQLARNILEEELKEAIPEICGQLQDNIDWISKAGDQIPQVGSKSRILYADSKGRIALARAFNKAIAEGQLKGPVILGRDHHDVSGTDSPFRETANIYDGSKFTADMAVQNVIGDSFRGATWVSLHNGGGVGWGEVVNGGFGLVLDGSPEAEQKAENMLHWDVNNGIARRAWARNKEALLAVKKEMNRTPNLEVPLPALVREDLLNSLFEAG
jgi:urocanate hydratase